MYTSTDQSVRPSFRIAGVIVCLIVAAVSARTGYELISAEGASLATCRLGKGQIFCELNKLLASVLPARLHLSLEGLAWWVFSGVLVLTAFNLSRPVHVALKKRKST